VRRIKAINWGKKSSGPDCFVVAMITADPASGVTGVIGTGIEECIAITPGSGNVGPVIAFHAGPKDDSGTNAEGYGSGPFIRNCLVDCGWPTDTNEVRGLSMAWCKNRSKGHILQFNNWVHFKADTYCWWTLRLDGARFLGGFRIEWRIGPNWDRSPNSRRTTVGSFVAELWRSRAPPQAVQSHARVCGTGKDAALGLRGFAGL
jgi:hypothetical protein